MTTESPAFADRHPVRTLADGDFELGEVLALDCMEANSESAVALGNSRNGPTAEPLNEADTARMHSFETSSVFNPPVSERLNSLTPQVASEWLGIARRWIEAAESSPDLRYLNTACKLVGAVWVQYNCDVEFVGLRSELVTVADVLQSATDRLRHRLEGRVLLTESNAIQDSPPPRAVGHSSSKILVLARAGSSSAVRLVVAATRTGLLIDHLCWYSEGRPPKSLESNYSKAWYPPPAPASETAATIPDHMHVTHADSWEDVEHAVRGSDLVLLVGMPIVPPHLLKVPRLGVFNAHNGLLPTLRGMDAIGWAILHNHPIVCTLHVARPKVDTGEVIATHPVPIAPTATLAARVKATQLRLLLAGAAYVAATNEVPDATMQPAGGAQYYRLHPHLKRVLDTSPYGRNADGR